jgi:hypothetical protein
MTHLPQLTLELRRVRMFGAAADLPQAEGAKRPEVAIGLADAAANLRDLQLALSVVSSMTSVTSA